MGSYFEKLKRGMDIKGGTEEIEEIEEKKEEAEKKDAEKLEGTEKKEKLPKEKLRTKKNTEIKKIEIEVESIDSSPRETKEEVPKEKKERWFGQEGQLTVDVYKTNEYLVIQSAIAGIKPENLDISIENDLIMIRGIREKTAEVEKKDYFYQECYWGPFSRQIILPEEVDPSRVEATMKEGILTIRIPLIERQRRRKILVK